MGVNDARIALGHLMAKLSDAMLSQGFDWDREWVLGLLTDAGLMWQDDKIKAQYHLSPLADACIEAYRATVDDEDPDA